VNAVRALKPDHDAEQQKHMPAAIEVNVGVK